MSRSRLRDAIVKRAAYYHGSPTEGVKSLSPSRNVTNPAGHEGSGNEHGKEASASTLLSAGVGADRLREAIKTSAAKKSSCVALMLPPAAANQFPPTDIPDMPKKQQMPPHVTIFYCQDLTDKDAKTFEEAVRRAAARVEPFGVSSNGLRHFRANNGDDAAHVKIVSEGARKLNKYIKEELDKVGLKYDQTYPEYKPHATLKYMQPGNTFQGKVPTFVVPIHGIEIWRGDARGVKIPLGIKAVKDPKGVHRLAELFGVKWDDDPDFLGKSDRITGEAHLDDMSKDQIRTVAAALRGRRFKGAERLKAQLMRVPREGVEPS